MAQDTVLAQLLPLVGGKDNISSQRQEGQRLFLRLKDESLSDPTALQALGIVKSCTLKNGQLHIVLLEEKKEEHNMANNKQIAEQVLQGVGGKGRTA